MGIKLVPVGIGSHINIRELERINNDGRDVIHFGEYENPKNVGRKIMHGTLQTLLYWLPRKWSVLRWFREGILYISTKF